MKTMYARLRCALAIFAIAGLLLARYAVPYRPMREYAPARTCWQAQPWTPPLCEEYGR